MLTQPVLENFLRLVRADDTADVVLRAIGIFDSYGLSDYMSTYEWIFTESDGITDEERAQNLVEITSTLCKDIMTQQGVMLVDNIHLSTMLDMAEATHAIIDYEDHQTLMDICNTQAPSMEVYGTLLSHVSHLTVETILLNVKSVSAGLVSNLRQELQASVQPHSENDTTKIVLGKYTTWKTKCTNDTPLFTDQYTKQSSTIEMPFLTYLSMYEKNNAIVPEPNVEQLRLLAMELISMALLSFDGSGNPLMIIRQYLPHIYNDIALSTKLDQQVNTLLAGYNRL